MTEQVPSEQKSSDDRCTSSKCGEYDRLRCCRRQGHDGEHCYVVVRDTPKTDAVTRSWRGGRWVPADFAKAQEREIAQLRAKVDSLEAHEVNPCRDGHRNPLTPNGGRLDICLDCGTDLSTRKEL